MTSYPIFISLRFGEAMTEAKALKAALEAQHLPTFLCDVAPGDDIAKTVIKALDCCTMAVILGTATYGRDTRVGFSSFDELRFICEDEKPFFLVKMCDVFEEAETRFRLPKAKMHFSWRPGTPVPDTLVPAIIKKLEGLGGSSTIRTPEPDRPLDPAPKTPLGKTV